MATLAQWEALKPAYRKRLLQAGYTRDDYLADRPRQAARGHGKTPERPSRATPERYPEYIAARQPRTPLSTKAPANRDTLINRIYGELVPLLLLPKDQGGITRLDRSTIEYGVMNMPDETYQYAWDLPVEEWRGLGRFPYTGPGADLWYRDQDPGQNPFYYH